MGGVYHHDKKCKNGRANGSILSSAALAQEPVVVQEYQLENNVLSKQKATLLVFPGANTDGTDLRCLKLSGHNGYAGMGGLTCHWSGTPTKDSVAVPTTKQETPPAKPKCVGRGCNQ